MNQSQIGRKRMNFSLDLGILSQMKIKMFRNLLILLRSSTKRSKMRFLTMLQIGKRELLRDWKGREKEIC